MEESSSPGNRAITLPKGVEESRLSPYHITRHRGSTSLAKTYHMHRGNTSLANP